MPRLPPPPTTGGSVSHTPECTFSWHRGPEINLHMRACSSTSLCVCPASAQVPGPEAVAVATSERALENTYARRASSAAAQIAALL